MNTLAEHFSKFLPEQVEVLTLEKFKDHEAVQALISLETSLKEKYSNSLISIKMIIKVELGVAFATLLISDKPSFHKIRIKLYTRKEYTEIFPLELCFERYTLRNLDFSTTKVSKSCSELVCSIEEILKNPSFQSKMKMILKNSKE